MRRIYIGRFLVACASRAINDARVARLVQRQVLVRRLWRRPAWQESLRNSRTRARRIQIEKSCQVHVPRECFHFLAMNQDFQSPQPRHIVLERSRD